ncbi:DUF4296 domain-containing protein [Ferruginibacter sp. HRS2-29]|uniref:DUF4296 domain-containing protein n=1 Tax=Ferruginibacter sp. HRS2-29 TaxID=2487334 RepID=UPI0020CD9F5B|nr:DUF4296 domain-containing protein [Ferruginibacter sp. HRS2-29]MCP9750851.1 DUF4296 domain-containing protein [Ferruginibacter sp. HRS2-29]
MMRYLLAMLLCTVLFACSDKKSRGIIEPDKMQEVLWDYIRADIFTTDFISVDSSKNLPAENVRLQKAIFAKYKITKEEFYNSYTWYQQHPDEMQVLLDSMTARKRRIPDPQIVVPVVVTAGPDSLAKRDSNYIPRNRLGRGRIDTSNIK